MAEFHSNGTRLMLPDRLSVTRKGNAHRWKIIFAVQRAEGNVLNLTMTLTNSTDRLYTRENYVFGYDEALSGYQPGQMVPR
jgi:hypothetical protein